MDHVAQFRSFVRSGHERAMHEGSAVHGEREGGGSHDKHVAIGLRSNKMRILQQPIRRDPNNASHPLIQKNRHSV